MAAKLVLSHLGDQVPDDNISIFCATGKPYPRLVKCKLSDRRLVAIEVDEDGRNFAVPEPDAAIFVSNGKEIRVGLALGYGSDWSGTSFVFPTAEQLTLLYVPAKYLFVCRDNGLAYAGAISFLGLPDNVGGGRGDNTKRFGMLVFAAVPGRSVIFKQFQGIR